MTEKLHYDFLPQLDNPANVHRIEMEMIPIGSLVLDVGCHTGILGEILRKEKQAKVIGIDTDSEALRVAGERLQAAHLIDVEQDGWSENLLREGFHNFDVILFGDVLEHTRYPERILLQAKNLLRIGGRIVVSVPNVAHWRVRLGLLFGRFEYGDSGILDRTHLRFFTRQSAKALLENSGYHVLATDVAGYSLPHWLIRMFPGLFAVQIVMNAEPR
ncbi:MAG: methionine biosynthesis protein MetW [Bacteroidota bacterium]|nr:methionine biosynthesis protein MetW [Bacteroidota bacterium]MDP4230232.1 methionine biosynthesis protein MetW [Bacteroidota bacterium]MDP4236504.1 methionine biosynthesis protein MetW [Bacteroidota bacterium]